MSEHPEVQLERATASARPLLENMLELYIHDLSEVFPCVLGDDGRFGYPRLGSYFIDPERRFPFLIRDAAGIAGFALVTLGSPASDDPETRDIAEFFVLRGKRRTGVGAAAARLAWQTFPGAWTVRVSEGNRGALPFWSALVREYTGGAFSEVQRPAEPHPWRVFSFRSS